MGPNKDSKLIIFDLDGTLIHFPFNYFFSETHRIFDKNNWGLCNQEILEDCFSDFDYFRFMENHPDLELRKENFWLDFDWFGYPKALELEHVSTALSNLKSKSYMMAIAAARSSSLDELIEELSPLSIFSHFSSIHYRDDKNQDWKDKSPQILRVLSDLNVSPENAILVGDTPSDIESAKRAKIRGSIAVLTGGIKERVLINSGPDRVIISLRDLVGALDELGF